MFQTTDPQEWALTIKKTTYALSVPMVTNPSHPPSRVSSSYLAWRLQWLDTLVGGWDGLVTIGTLSAYDVFLIVGTHSWGWVVCNMHWAQHVFFSLLWGGFFPWDFLLYPCCESFLHGYFIMRSCRDPFLFCFLRVFLLGVVLVFVFSNKVSC